MIFYACPDLNLRSGGIRRIYTHVEILVKNGFDASVLHNEAGFRLSDMPDVPIAHLSTQNVINPRDIIVIPEGYVVLMEGLNNLPVRRFVIALNPQYIFNSMRDDKDWRDYGVERVLAVSPFIAESVAWSMGLPVHLLDYAIDSKLYYYQLGEKTKKITFFGRKAKCVQSLKRVLRCRNRAFVDDIIWRELTNLSEEDYAVEIRQSTVFLALSTEEGLSRTAFEAMSSGTVVGGFDGVGGHDVMIGSGDEQNCVLVQNGDFIRLAQALEPLLQDILDSNMEKWQPIIRNAQRLVASHTLESEENSVIRFWKEVI